MKPSWKRIIILHVILLLLILIAISIWHPHLKKKNSSPQQIDSMTESTVTNFHFPISPIYLQNDPRWKDDKMGGSQETLNKAGCFVCCVSMAFAHYGIDLTPGQLNESLKKNEGYTEQGWVKWGTISKIAQHKIGLDVPNQPNLVLIDIALKLEEPVLAKILLKGRVPHWVLIVGKEGQDYLVKDPMGDGQSLDKLSQFKSKIYAIRIVKKME
ncbi:cysteine peptidase family C39 domain-containing protein [Candidatus Parabeggiatoa sp. HSG14]|uniref:cysteine peptidase family C39 domain-containing protein n=1 Tax=Candidatus Parabeggiatoa sp. HSG14 TaxID=3055593 RepID=UPI0025A6C2CA|nr:cysteine peptidase family C39 domain-containing protein [Thiotrichales bacterium HSG14]